MAGEFERKYQRTVEGLDTHDKKIKKIIKKNEAQQTKNLF